MLFYRGNIKCLYEDCVAIVGTRRPTQKAMEATYYLARDLAQENKTIVSGLALGIDTFAHKGSLSAENGKTVAILPCGLDVIYPSTNKKLASQIIQRDGCLISEYPPGEEPLKWHFLARNKKRARKIVLFPTIIHKKLYHHIGHILFHFFLGSGNCSLQ